MQTHNLPKAFDMYFSTVYSKGNKKSIFYARLITQIFTKSNYEHVAVCLQCPQEFDGTPVKDSQGVTFLKAGKYYVFEANKNDGIIIQSLEGRIEGMYSPSKKWSGKVFIQPREKRPKEGEMYCYEDFGNLKASFKDAIKMLGYKYTTVWAVLSAFDKIKFVRFILKLFRIKPKLNKQAFCSSFAEINNQVFNSEKINKKEAITLSPEQLRLKNYQERGYVDERKFLEIKDGRLLSVNPKYLTVL